MADFTDVIEVNYAPTLEGDTNMSVVSFNMFDAPPPPPPSFFQRIYDSTVGYVYYTLSAINTAPAPGVTTPNHTNNLFTATHEVIKEN